MHQHKNLFVVLLAIALLLPTIGCSVSEIEPIKPVGIQPFLKDKIAKK